MEALARHRLSRAHEALEEGKHLLEKRAMMGAVNRLYYAAFHAARAMLATRQVDPSRHSGVMSLFQEHFVKTGMIPLDTAKVLPRTFEKRQDADYGDYATVTFEEAMRVATEVHGFVQECQQALERLIAERPSCGSPA